MNKKATIVAVALCAALAFGGCSKKEEPVVAEATPKTPVETLTIEKSAIKSEYQYSGKAKPINEVSILSTVSGKVLSVNFDVGDRVNAGDVLFIMDTADLVNSRNVLQAQLQSVQAQIESAQTSADLANGATMQTQIESAKTALANAELAYNNVKTTHENNKVLYEQGIISKAAFDQDQMSYDSAKIAYEQAQASYDLIANQMPQENMEKAEAALKVAKASKASIEAQIASTNKTINDARVTSPISGVVSACNVKAGTVLSQGAGAPFTIIDISSMDMEVNVSEQVINSLQPGQQVMVKIPSISDETRPATIDTISPAASQDGTYKVKIRIPNPDNVLKAGMFAEVSFTNKESLDTVVVPRDTVVTKNNETFVFVFENGIAKRIPVTLGIDNGVDVELTSGVTEGMEIIINGQAYLVDGEEVQIVQGLEKKGETETENTENPDLQGTDAENNAADAPKGE